MQLRSFLLHLIASATVVGVLLFCKEVSAAQLFFKIVPNSDINDRAVIVEVWLDPEQQDLNVVEGVINFQGEIADQLAVNVETGGSVLTLWTTAPQYLISDQAIRFVGGVPGGFSQESLLLRLRLSSPEPGSAVVAWIGGMAYRNDGQGTKENIFAKSLTINLDGQKSTDVKKTSSDETAPEFKFIDIGRDASVYDGQYFISFTAVDDSSGVARYIVKEGGAETEVTEGVYVFKDQSRHTPVTIIAYDQAGNSRMTEIPPLSARSDWLKYVIILLIGISVLFFIFLNVYRQKNKK